MMYPVEAQDVLLQFFKDGDYYDFACITDFSLETVTDSKEVRTIGQGQWRKIRGQRLSYTLNASGLVELQGSEGPYTYWLMQFQLGMLHVDWRAVWIQPQTGLRMYATGRVLITRSLLAAASQGFATGEFTMEGDGAYTLSYTANDCEASIGYANISASEAGQITVEYDFVIDAVRFDYTIDGGERESIFDPGTSGTFVIVGIPEGDHVLVIYPICENGNDGFPNSLEFEMTGSGAESCLPVYLVEVGLTTTTEAMLSWSRTGGIPPGGFEWELSTAANPDTIAQSGTTMDDYLNLSGLSPAVQYIFRVKAICEAGVSESAFTYKNFTTAAPVCNAPGVPVISLVTGTTATATWTAASPAPESYHWQLITGTTAVQVDVIPGTTVNLTGLTPGTNYTFRVRSFCLGGGISSYATTTFVAEEPPPADNIDWSFAPGPFTGSLEIKRNAAVIVSVTSADSGTFSAAGGDSIEMTIDANSETGMIEAYNTTTSTVELSITGTSVQSGSFAVADGNNYSLTGTISS